MADVLTTAARPNTILAVSSSGFEEMHDITAVALFSCRHN
jgi:hypothetical protein